MADLEDLELERRGRHRDQRLGHLAIERFFAKAADDDGDVAEWRAWISLRRWR